MSNGRAYKSDESFLEKISIGAIGTRSVFDDLQKQEHAPIELERGSMSFKIWKSIKIKRVRVPDVLCVKCGTRIESRAKTKLEISMSHSLSDASRGWDFGMKDSDFVALIRCKKSGSSPIDWRADSPVQYISVSELREAYSSGYVVEEKPKGAGEGFERRISWLSTTAGSAGIITEISEDKLQFKKNDTNRTITLKLKKKGIKLYPLVSVGDLVEEGQIIASVVRASKLFSCPANKTIRDYIAQLDSPSISDKYASIKAISKLGAFEAKDALMAKMLDTREHVYVRLEAGAALTRIGDDNGINFLKEMTNNEYLENRLETIIILGEISNKVSLNILSSVLFDSAQNTEIRAAAAWAIGELRNPESIHTLVRVFDNVDDSIKIEAARSIAKLADKNTPQLLEHFRTASGEQRHGIAWAIGQRGTFTIKDILPYLIDKDSRQWISYVIGSKSESGYISQIEELKEKDPEVYFAVTVLWKIISSWIYNLKEY